MFSIGIIGGGAAGTLLAIQLIEQSQGPLQIDVYDGRGEFVTGIAYAASSLNPLLNVTAGRMSLWPEKPNHFVDYVQTQPEYSQFSAELLAQTYLPRPLYGRYLHHQWQQSLQLAAQKGICVQHIPEAVQRFSLQGENIDLDTGRTQQQYQALVLATGNETPKDPLPHMEQLLTHPAYLANPWQPLPVSALNACSRVLIIGNGLTMVDTVLALRHHGVRHPITSLSPHGFGMLPHRAQQLKYPTFPSGLPTQLSLLPLLRQFNQTRKQIRQLGLPAEPLIDALRPLSQQIWTGFSLKDKQRFIKKLRHLWGVARHRLPLHIFDQIQQLRLQGALDVKAANLVQISDAAGALKVQFRTKTQPTAQHGIFDLVINCTGPQADFRQLPDHLLAQQIKTGLLAPGPLNLGLAACPNTFALKNADGQLHHQLFAMGSLLRGELWETTALHEIRQQAQQLATQLLKRATVEK